MQMGVSIARWRCTKRLLRKCARQVQGGGRGGWGAGEECQSAVPADEVRGTVYAAPVTQRVYDVCGRVFGR
jgi:hypothetical protein